MGTRNLVIVYHKGEYRIVQYGQWDGYPSGQGLVILKWLKEPGNIEKLRSVLDAGDSHIYEWDPKNSTAEEEMHPSLSRDTGARILALALKATEENPMPVELAFGFIADYIFCEWIWVVDLDKNVFEGYGGFCNYEGEEREKHRFHPIIEESYPLPQLLRSFPLAELPKSKTAFVRSFNDHDYLAREQMQGPYSDEDDDAGTVGDGKVPGHTAGTGTEEQPT